MRPCPIPVRIDQSTKLYGQKDTAARERSLVSSEGASLDINEARHYALHVFQCLCLVEFFSSFAKMLVSRVNAGQKAQKWSSLIQSMENSVSTLCMNFGAIPMSFGQVRGP